MHKNRLAHSLSPYLQQHANNPVNWHPWDKEALELARKENKPIFLSIGYAACHWCHVMAHESFEDQATAEIMNNNFINIKVDREERPDLDKIYQTAHQLLTGRGGGWPLSVFLTPEDQTPFFAGTYFPKDPRYGMITFKELLLRIAEFFANHRSNITRQNTELLHTLNQLNTVPSQLESELTAKPLLIARQQLEKEFDPIYGGFFSAPKFPHPNFSEFLLYYWHKHPSDAQVSTMLTTTLDKMGLGGIYDHIGGGFFRYTTDQRWLTPHFEKMLYDNAQLLMVYATAYRITAISLYEKIVKKTADWAKSELQSPQGGYFGTLDADSEGVEGKYYYWDRSEVKALLTNQEYAVIEKHFGLTQDPNFEGHWHLYNAVLMPEIAQQLQLPLSKVQQFKDSAQKKLFVARSKRHHPRRDEKILTAWNALMIKAMALAGEAIKRPDYIESACRALLFIQNNLYKNGRLLASFKDGQAYLPAYLDDYAFLLDAVLTVIQIRFRTQDLQFAIQLADNLLQYFQDEENGGFFFTANDHERLIYRPKPLQDDAIPAGNAIAARGLLRLGHLLGDNRYLNAAEKTLKAAWPAISTHPYVHCSFLLALQEWLDPPEIVILRGPASLITGWKNDCQQSYHPERMWLTIPDTTLELPENLHQYASSKKTPLAYVCKGLKCLPPVDNVVNLRKYLRNKL